MEVDERVLEVEEGVCAVVLQVLSSESLRELQLKLFEREAEEPASRLGLLWDRLASRLGHDAVLRAGVVEHTLPENTVRFEQVSHVKSTVSAPVPPEVEERPLRIYSSPTRILAEWPKTFLWNGQTTRIASFSGPERIETAWWEKRDQRRDYYVVETESGARYWIFQRLDDGGWFMHGVFE
jgi:protein ImuB